MYKMSGKVNYNNAILGRIDCFFFSRFLCYAQRTERLHTTHFAYRIMVSMLRVYVHITRARTLFVTLNCVVKWLDRF